MSQIIDLLLKIKAVKTNFKEPFQWTSGVESPIYINNRIIGSYPKERKIIFASLAKLVMDKFPKANMLIGFSTGGIIPAAFVGQYTNLPVGYVRPKVRKHGTKNQIEGFVKPNTSVVIIEDLIATGGSVGQAVMLFQEAGIEVLGVVSIFSYQMNTAKKRFGNLNVPFYSLANLSELFEVMLTNGELSPEEAKIISSKIQT